jgi:hypothetical protein
MSYTLQDWLELAINLTPDDIDVAMFVTAYGNLKN